MSDHTQLVLLKVELILFPHLCFSKYRYILASTVYMQIDKMIGSEVKSSSN